MSKQEISKKKKKVKILITLVILFFESCVSLCVCVKGIQHLLKKKSGNSFGINEDLTVTEIYECL